MLFYISQSFSRSVANGDNESMDCLMRILDSRRRGLILIYAKPKSIDVISNHLKGKGDERSAEFFKSASRKFREKRQLLKDLTAFVFVSLSQKNSPRRRWNFISASPYFINRSNILYPPVFLGENLSDCTLYVEKISKFFTSGIPVSMKQIHMSDRFEPGGGNSTHTSYRRHKEKGIDFCYCVVDSDRKSPYEKEGDTAKFVRKVDKDDQSALCKHLVIDVYSAENLLPINELERQFAVGKSVEQAEKFSIIRKIRNHPGWRYLPLKKGVQGKDLKSSGNKSYWWSQLNLAGVALPCCNEANCTCCVIPSVSDKSLATALLGNLDWTTELNDEHNSIVREDYLKITRELRSWLCVGQPIRLS